MNNRIALGRACGVAAALVAASVLVGPLQGFDRPKVYVCFELGDRLRGLEGPNDEWKDTEARLSTVLREVVEQSGVYRNWVFADCEADRYPRLRVWLERADKWYIRAAIVVSATAENENLGAPRDELFGGAELAAMGGLHQGASWWRPYVKKGFEEWLERHDEEFRPLIYLIPLGQDVALSNPPARGVLPLEWAGHKGLAKSTFRVVFRSSSDSLELVSTGKEKCEDYPAVPPFKGILVEFDEMVRNGLTPRAFYLSKYTISTDAWCE